MNKVTQKEAVFHAVMNVVGEFDGACNPTSEQRKVINQILFTGFREGTIEYKGTVPTDQKLREYVSGLQSNWLRKDKRLNGGVQYEPKNPGSRAGSGDSQVKAMRALLSTQTDPVRRAEIQSFIDKRLAEIKPTKATALSAEQIAVLEAAGLGHFVTVDSE